MGARSPGEQGRHRRYSPTEWAPTEVGSAVVEKVDDPAHHRLRHASRRTVSWPRSVPNMPGFHPRQRCESNVGARSPDEQGRHRRYSPTEWASTEVGSAVVEEIDDPAHHRPRHAFRRTVSWPKSVPNMPGFHPRQRCESNVGARSPGEQGRHRQYLPTEWAPTEVGSAVVEEIDDPAHHQDIINLGVE